MKVNRVKRMRPAPLEWVTFSAAEDTECRALARSFVGTEPALGLAELTLIRAALGTEIGRLEAAAEWSTGETDDDRLDRLHRSRLLYRAVEMACARVDQ